MTLEEAVAHVKASGLQASVTTDGLIVAPTSFEYRAVTAYENAVHLRGTDGSGWDLWRSYPSIGQVRVASFLALADAVKFAVLLAPAANLADEREYRLRMTTTTKSTKG